MNLHQETEKASTTSEKWTGDSPRSCPWKLTAPTRDATETESDGWQDQQQTASLAPTTENPQRNLLVWDHSILEASSRAWLTCFKTHIIEISEKLAEEHRTSTVRQDPTLVQAKRASSPTTRRKSKAARNRNKPLRTARSDTKSRPLLPYSTRETARQHHLRASPELRAKTRQI